MPQIPLWITEAEVVSLVNVPSAIDALERILPMVRNILVMLITATMLPPKCSLFFSLQLGCSLVLYVERSTRKPKYLIRPCFWCLE